MCLYVYTYIYIYIYIYYGTFYNSPGNGVRNHHTLQEVQSDATLLRATDAGVGNWTGQVLSQEQIDDTVASKEEIEYIIEEGEEEEVKEEDPEIRS